MNLEQRLKKWGQTSINDLFENFEKCLNNKAKQRLTFSDQTESEC